MQYVRRIAFVEVLLRCDHINCIHEFTLSSILYTSRWTYGRMKPDGISKFVGKQVIFDVLLLLLTIKLVVFL
jgi:hypothetical protein